jgi:asparagine synthase (glutamine-hydrolysing)
MPRIAGIQSAGPPHKGNELLARMMQESGARGWSERCERSGRAAVGWCGWQAPEVATRDGLAIVLDGHIYNRTELEDSGSDAELLLSLFQRHGFVDALRRLNGDFAAALHDSATDTLWLGRDRFGIKPLYYAQSPGRLAFASRPRALLALPGMSREVNRLYAALFAASHYRYFDNRPEESPYAQIAQLPAGHWLCARSGRVSRGAYWSLQDLPDHEGSESELAERYRELLLDAVSRRLKTAQRTAFLLSGGMDSSSVLAAAVRATGRKQHAFSSVYLDKTYDESGEIRSMIGAAVERWHPVAVGTPDVFDLVQRMIAVHDEPVATATWLSHFLLCEEAAREGFASLFGGLGGDELNAGEYEHFLYFFADLRAAGDEEYLSREVGRWAHYHDHPVFRKSFQVAEAALTRLVDPVQPGRCLPDRKRMMRYSLALHPDFFDLRDFEPVMDHAFASYLKNRTYQDLTRETIPCCLRAENRQTVAFGLDNFLPFFDHRLVEFMFRVPGTLKYRDGVTKHLLRQAMCGVLPEETRTRVKKTGWNAPAHVWFSGPGRDQLLDLVHSQGFRERGIYHVPEVLRLIDEHEQIVSSGEPREHHMMFLWQLVNLELWFKSLETH